MNLPADRPERPPWPLYVLAGGQARRFGANKALAMLDGKPMISHVIAMFDHLAVAVWAVVDRPERLVPCDVPIVVDTTPGAGPAHALRTALRHRGEGWLWLAPCDVLGIETQWLQGLAERARPGVRAVAWRDLRWQPLPSLWHTDALPLVEAALARGEDALWQLLDAVSADAVPLPAHWSRVRRIDTQDALRAVQHERQAIQLLEILQVRGPLATRGLDALAVEAPLQMAVARGPLSRNLGITLRTPGDDVELAVGLAFSEEAIVAPTDIERTECTADNVTLHLGAHAPPPVDRNPRMRVTSAACGACGKSELDVTQVTSHVASGRQIVALRLLQTLPDLLRQRQVAFTATGALHAAGLFTWRGEPLEVREDVGRHNALDKLIGAAFLAGRLPLHDHILVVSGRVAFELVQKAALAGIPLMVAVGAPSSLAVEVAERAGMTLLGFVRPDRANVYTHPERVALD